MVDTFPIKGKRKTKGGPSGEETEDDMSFLEVFFKQRPSDEKRRSHPARVTDAAPGPNFLEILIFAASVCLWITFAILFGCHIVMVARRTESYVYMLHHPKMMIFVILQAASTIVELCAAICASLCVSYDVEAHNVILVAKLAIGFVSCNIGIFVAVLVVGQFASHSANEKLFSLVTVPVLVWVLKEAIVFVKLDLEARTEKAVVRGSASTIDLLHKVKPGSGLKRNIKFPRSSSNMNEAIIAELKFIKKLPDAPAQNDAEDMRNAIIRMMSEVLDSSEMNRATTQGVKFTEGNYEPSKAIPRENKAPQHSAASTSSVDPWSTTSPSTSDDGKDS